ncbi:MAG: glutathione S-transferase [Phycisphaerales bacterium]
MSDYTLYYWPLPFRGQLIRAVLAHAGKTWDEPGVDAITDVMGRDIDDQPLPFMAPPLLVDHANDVAMAQMPAALAYLGNSLGLMPDDPEPAALTHKIVADANDVLDEVTRFGGRLMWTREEWESFTQDRLPRWAQIFEATGRAHGLQADKGHILGTSEPGLADLVTATLWFTMTAKLPELSALVEANAPRVAALADRIMSTEALAQMRDDTDTRFGNAWCGGQIEASIREMLNGE